MENNNFRRNLGLDLYDKLNSMSAKTDLASQLISGYLKGQQNSDLLFEKLGKNILPNTPKFAWDLADSMNRTNRVFNFVEDYTSKLDSFNKISMGGHTLTEVIKYVTGPNTSTTGAALMVELEQTIFKHSKSYQSFLNLSENIYKISPLKIGGSQLYKEGLFNSVNFLEKNPKNLFDVLSGTTFANLTKLYKGSAVDLEDELKSIEKTFYSDTEFKAEAVKFVEEVAKADDKGYIKFDDLITNFVHLIMKRFGFSMQASHNLSVFLIFAGAFYLRDILPGGKQTQNINYKTNVYMAQPRIETDLIIKSAPVYEKDHSTSRKIGQIKENLEVEIKRKKAGWCLVKGVITVVHKKGKEKIDRDTLMTVWINQKYLDGYQ